MDDRRATLGAYPSAPPARVLTADPGWTFEDQLPGAGRGATKKYRCESIDQIAATPLPPIDERGAILCLWRTGVHQADALTVARAWGFEPFGDLIWIKLRPCAVCEGIGALRGEECPGCLGRGGKPFMGMGRRGPRNGHEVCMLASRGTTERLNADVLSWFEAPMPPDPSKHWYHPEHSGKPDRFYEIVESIWPGPYVEIHGRRGRAGWWSYGNALPHGGGLEGGVR